MVKNRNLTHVAVQLATIAATGDGSISVGQHIGRLDGHQR